MLSGYNTLWPVNHHNQCSEMYLEGLFNKYGVEMMFVQKPHMKSTRCLLVFTLPVFFSACVIAQISRLRQELTNDQNRGKTEFEILKVFKEKKHPLSIHYLSLCRVAGAFMA